MHRSPPAMLALTALALLTGCNLIFPPLPGQRVSGLPAVVGQFADQSVDVEDAALDLETDFFGRARRDGTAAALAGLDAALAEHIQSEVDLVAFIDRCNELGGRVVNPNEGADRFDILDVARTHRIRYEDARKIVRARQATAQSMPLCDVMSTVIFVNGMNVTYADFLVNMQTLKETIESAQIEDVDVIGVYQHSATDADRSIFGGVLCPFFGTVSTSFIGGLFRQRVSDLCRRVGGLLVDLGQSGDQKVTEWGLGPTLGSELARLVGDVNSVIRAIETAVKNGRVVVVVCHSQGNFFVRDAIGRLGGDADGPFANAVAVVQVASPSSQMPPPTTRVDICTDLVPKLLSTQFSQMTCLMAPPGRESFPASHDFSFSYLDPNGTQTQVVNAIRSYLPGGSQARSNPRTALNSGIVQATLRWNTSADIDLHVFEPDGTEVAFFHRTGNSGALDVDDTNGLGPENYFICRLQDVQQGNHRVEVHHYSGALPTSGTVRIRAGSEDVTYPFNVATEDQVFPIANIQAGEGGTFHIVPI